MKVTILCGISGSGKSTYVRSLASVTVAVSADYFFEQADGAYNFDPSKLSQAHGACLREFVQFVQDLKDKDGEANIVVDNTCTTVAEIAPYAALALAYDAELDIVIFDCPVDVAHARNVHGVPLEVVEAQAQRLAELDLPPWWPSRHISHDEDVVHENFDNFAAYMRGDL